MSNDQNTQKCHQKHHFYTTIFVRLCQNDQNAMSNPKKLCQTQIHGEPRSSDPRLSASMARAYTLRGRQARDNEGNCTLNCNGGDPLSTLLADGLDDGDEGAEEREGPRVQPRDVQWANVAARQPGARQTAYADQRG